MKKHHEDGTRTIELWVHEIDLEMVMNGVAEVPGGQARQVAKRILQMSFTAGWH